MAKIANTAHNRDTSLTYSHYPVHFKHKVRESGQIQSVGELVQSRLARIAPLELYPWRFAGDHMEKAAGLPVEFQWTSLWDMQRMLWSRDTSAAYVMAESDMGLLRTARLHYANGEPVFHVARDVVGYKLFGFDDVDWYVEKIVMDLITASVEHGLLEFYRETSGYLFELMQRTIVHKESLQIGAQPDDEIPVNCFGFQAFVLAGGLNAAMTVFAAECGWKLFKGKWSKRYGGRGSTNSRLYK